MASQLKNVKNVFQQYFRTSIIPDRIIELGTADGEFTHWIYELRKAVNNDFDFITIDFIKYPTKMPPTIRALDNPNMIYCEFDVFNHIDFIGSLVKERTLVLCDNGNKIKEVTLLTPYLKKDCVIMAHDYFESEEIFKDRNIWPCCEITWNDVKDLDLEKYNYDLMASAIWLSLIKK
jgi:hypothetical protein